MSTLSKLYTIYIVLYSEYCTTGLIIVSWNIISNTFALLS